MQINKVIFGGRLTKSPDLKALPSGKSVCNISLAWNESYTKDGEKKELVEYADVVAFGTTAENSAKYLTKGALCLVEGRLQTRSYEKDGVKHYRTEIIADRVQFGPKPEGRSDGVDEVPAEDDEEIAF